MKGIVYVTSSYASLFAIVSLCIELSNSYSLRLDLTLSSFRDFCLAGQFLSTLLTLPKPLRLNLCESKFARSGPWADSSNFRLSLHNLAHSLEHGISSIEHSPDKSSTHPTPCSLPRWTFIIFLALLISPRFHLYHLCRAFHFLSIILTTSLSTSSCSHFSPRFSRFPHSRFTFSRSS